ncbi:DUF1697 domain-containing protein [Thalassobacillus pellis]|uniref:DUF1697 domain-containing protein n=1 Tax=Thalassobacillus pellis TaxID=748008 RepID=UPI001960B7A7|nr:DUF1697 domain-containing protein [Thalassobacillus pellis]MBM7553341.1 uncharacterized protein (DUF1697 family) [Thalassobacillus pellis]
MPVYIAFLRGINVGGHNKIRMADLRETLAKLDLHNLKTYIQSGNILFNSEENEEDLQKKIALQIEDAFDISTPVVLRTAEQLQQIIQQCPFSNETLTAAAATAKGESLHVALLPEAPGEDGVNKLLSYTDEKEHGIVSGRDVYLLFHDSIRNSKLGNNLKKLGVPATVRNWKTLKKLTDMAE